MVHSSRGAQSTNSKSQKRKPDLKIVINIFYSFSTIFRSFLRFIKRENRFNFCLMIFNMFSISFQHVCQLHKFMIIRANNLLVSLPRLTQSDERLKTLVGLNLMLLALQPSIRPVVACCFLPNADLFMSHKNRIKSYPFRMNRNLFH